MSQAPRDDNRIPTLLGKSNTDGAPVPILADPATGRLLVNSSVSISSVSGNKTNNNAAPTNDNLGVLPAVANAAAPTYTEGDQVLLSTDLSGQVRVTGSLSVGGTADGASFSAGVSTGTPQMGAYHAVIDTVSDGKQAITAITSKRAQHANLRDASGTELGVAAAPLQVSLANTAANSTAVKVDNSAVTQPIVANDVTATGNITTQNLVPGGTATANSAVLSGTLNGQTTLTVQVTGTYTGSLSLQGTVDNTNWITVGGIVFTNVNTGAQTATITSAATGIFQADCGGYQQVRVTGLAAMTGTATVTMRASTGAGLVALDAALPTGSNVIGGVTVASGGIASGAIASGAVASGAIASGAIASGAAVAGSFVDGALVTLGAKTDAAATQTDGTAVSIVSILKEISAKAQSPAALPANQSVNNAQINGVTPLMGNGTTGTGSQRVTIASDNTPFAVKTDQTTHGTTDLVAADLTKIAGGAVTATNVAITDAPLNIGAQGISSDNSAITTARKVQLVSDLLGKLIVHPYCLPQQLVSGVTSDVTNTTATTIIAGVASNYLYITGLLVTNSHATVSTFVNITEETSGTILYTGYALAAGGGFSKTFTTPIKVPTAGKGLQVTCVTTGANVRVSAEGYKATI